MSLEISREEFAAADLIVVVDRKGKFQWSSKRTLTQTASMLRKIAREIEKGK